MSEKNWQGELTAYIDGELGDDERRAVEAALARDPKLKALEAKLRQTVTLVGALAAPAPSAALKARVLERLDDAPAKVSWLAWPRLVPVVALAAAALLVVVLRPGRDEVPPTMVVDEQVLLAQHLEVVEDLDLLGLTSLDDLDVIERLDALEEKP